MTVGVAQGSARLRLPDWVQGAKGPVLIALLYFAGAQAAFFIGTLSDRIFAPLWPPNVVLFCAFMVVPRKRWALYLAATFPAHVVAEVGVGMPADQLLVAFATNGLIAVVAAWAAQRLLGSLPWFNNLRKTSVYVLAIAIAIPALCAFGGAFVRILGGGAFADYGFFWLEWFAANVLGFLALAPAALIGLGDEAGSLAAMPTRRKFEALVIGACLVVACVLAFAVGAHAKIVFLPALAYLPLPVILWSAVRFGSRGASASIFIVTVVLVWSALKGPSLFVASDSDTNVMALQAFVTGLALPVLLLGAAIDGTRSAEQTARLDEERIRFAAVNGDVAFWDMDRATGRLWLTDHGRTMLGLPRDAELTGETFVSAVHPADREQVRESLRRAAYTGELQLNEFRVALPDGQIRWLLAKCYAQRDAAERSMRISGYFADITARKVAEHEAEQQRREATHLLRVSMLGELSGAIAHELNQPLTAILANAQAGQQLIARKDLDLDRIRDILNDIVAEDDRASEVIERLRSLLRKGEKKSDAIDLAEVVASTVGLLHSELVRRNIRVDLTQPDKMPSVTGDRVQLQQVVLNLLMNAMEAMSSAPAADRAISVDTLAVGGCVEVAIRDHGCGIAANQHAAILEPFFTTKEDGLGLGLSICQTIIRSHGGELRIENQDGGVRAAFTLPRAGGVAGSAS